MPQLGQSVAGYSAAAACGRPNRPARACNTRYGFSDAMRRCDVQMANTASSILSQLWALHNSKITILLDQGLLLFPLVLLGGCQMMGGANSPLAVAGAGLYYVLLCVRLRDVRI